MDQLESQILTRVTEAQQAFANALDELEPSDALRVLAGGDVSPHDPGEMTEAVFCRDRLKRARKLFHLVLGVT